VTVGASHAIGTARGDVLSAAYLEAALDCVIMADASGRVVEFNPAAERTFGYTREQALGRMLSELIVPPSLRERHSLAFARFVESREERLFGQRLELIGMRADGTEFPVELTLSRVEGEPLLICGALRDISEAKRARDDLRRLVDELAALRRVATLVARGAPPERVFAAVADEVGRLLDVESAELYRYEDEGSAASYVASWNRSGITLPLPPRVTLDGPSLAAMVRDTGRPARIDDYYNVPGSVGDTLTRPLGIRAGIGCPVVVDGQLWGVMAASAFQPQPFPEGEEARLAEFTELVATAISNASIHSSLIASRARLVTAADEARRRIERDLHDGTQQRLVSLGLEIQTIKARVPDTMEDVHADLERVTEAIDAVLGDVREISRGLHPAILSRTGLAGGLRALARRSAVQVELAVDVKGRLPLSIEVAVYYVVSEALTNAAKHAQASIVHVDVSIAADRLLATVRDDGVGGALATGGSGLVGIEDRIEALGGIFKLASPLGAGTTIHVELPVTAEIGGDPTDLPSASRYTER
jgi:PAS domain S-box-containing protein